MNVKNWPVRFSVFATGKQIGVEWFPAAAENLIEQIEERAAFFARIEGVEVDIETGSVMPSGAIGTWERMGMRVRPE